MKKKDKKLKLRGFTIFEVLLSFTIMFLLAAASIPLLFKKAKKPSDPKKPVGEFVCSCATGSGTCEWQADDAQRNEFFTVQILGGGGGGGTGGKGGGAGEAKLMYYPAMMDKYKIVLGEGGDVGGNGGATIIYKIDKVTNAQEVLEYARGGISSNEKAEEGSDDSAGANSTFSENGCGKGGDAGAAGTMGEVIIRW